MQILEILITDYDYAHDFKTRVVQVSLFMFIILNNCCIYFLIKRLICQYVHDIKGVFIFHI